MAKKAKKKNGPPECPPWIMGMTDGQLERLKNLKQIAVNADTCEANLTISHLREGGGKGLWLVGNAAPIPGNGKRKAR